MGTNAMWHADVARKLTYLHRNVLLAHLDGPRTFEAGKEGSAARAIVSSGLLRFVHDAPRKRHLAITTELTEDGRMVLGCVLGDFADALVAAGFLTEPLPRLPSGSVDFSLRFMREDRGEENLAHATAP